MNCNSPAGLGMAMTLGALVVACGSSSNPSASPAPAANTTEVGPIWPATPDVGEGVAWADKTYQQKGAFMGAKVMPAVTAIWKDSPKAGEEVTCVTCHGEGAEQGKFKMPNPSLPQLDPSNGMAAHKDSPWLEFMATKLTPTMVETLGVEPYDMQTREGFGCFACHTMKGGE